LSNFGERGGIVFEPWIFSAIEEDGYMDTSEGLINKVSKYLANSQNDVINTAEFRNACIACNVDPDSFSQSDLEKLQRKLK